MKRIIILLFSILPLVTSAQEFSKIKFSSAGTWTQLLKEAKTSNKFILIDAFTTWCGPCKQMDKEVFSDPDVTAFINQNFVFIKVQMDSTSKDNNFVKTWHQQANALKPYVTAYPCFLFFTPDGSYAGRELGYHPAKEFISIVKKSIEPETSYFAQLSKFRNSSLSKKELLSLIITANENKDTVAKDIANFYKQQYIDGKPVDSLLNPETESYLSRNYRLFNANEPLIHYMRHNPERADSLFKRPDNFSSKISDALILQDYVYKVILPNDIAIKSTPDWKRLQANIKKDFGKATAERLIINAKIFWAYKHENFPEAAKQEILKAEKYGFDTTGIGRVFFNNTMYDIVFKYSEDQEVLKKAVTLMKYVTELDNHTSANNLDTYASLLYKVGEKKRAIEIEKTALEVVRKENTNDKGERIKLFAELLQRMKNGEEIWKE